MSTDLVRLNREFYDSFAAEFSRSREAINPGIQSMLGRLDCTSVLDVGCGDGRVSKALPADSQYLGLDFSAKLIGRNARGNTAFVLADLVYPLPVAARSFPAVLCLAVLHHLPDRLSLMRELARAVKPGGQVVVSVWQFTHDERMRKKIVQDLGHGDYVLDWERGGHGLRFVHEVKEGELKTLANEAGLRVREMFQSDGKSDDLSLYAILQS